MSSILEPDHPYWFVRSAVEKMPEVRRLNFSFYVYKPRTIDDSRTEFSVGVTEFLSTQYMEKLLISVPKDSEMAFHSVFETVDGDRKHLPLIDMSTPSLAHLEKLREFLGAEFFGTFGWFSSGRSFHGYSSISVSEIDWIRFMGLLLLANQRDLKSTVDPRWIGHRLLAGYSALRWTKNTIYYFKQPKKVNFSNPYFLFLNSHNKEI